MRPLISLTLTILLASPTLAEADDFRTFTSSDGKSLEAKLIAATATEATIIREDGKEFTLPLSRLSTDDQAYITTWSEEQKNAPSPAATVNSDVTLDAINEAIGHDLFADGNLWANDPEEVATRLDWPQESKTATQSSFRKYAPADYRFFNARPYSLALYGTPAGTTSISIVFANKGDFFGAKGSGEEHFDRAGNKLPDPTNLDEAIELDVKLISEELTAILGEPEKQTFGEGEAKRDVLRWDWSGHSFLLSQEDREFVSIAIETNEFADQKGRIKRVSETADRQRARDNVETRSNGDVVIGDIPMVDQGPKGYCAPATAERCMRQLGMAADMYLLAMAGNTGMGGGTSLTTLLDNIGNDIRRKGKKFDIFTEDEVDIRKLAKFIDDGIPVMWTLFSTPDFNKTANERTKERKEVTDWAEWTTRMQAIADEPALKREQVGSHVVIIIGYNKETGEIAFSDSWGDKYKERWVTTAEADKVSQNRYYVIDF
ncbi:MAG: hypothetical protein AAGD22_04695 [Verrucomicrobiota bacterium]